MFKDIPGYEGLYQININTQQVKSVERIHKGFGYLKKERIMKACVRKDFYHSFIFCRGKELNRVYLHRLVMLIKEGPCPEGMMVCHNDGNPANNHPDNLRYGTPKENTNDSKMHGTLFDITKVVPLHSKKCYYTFKGNTYYFNSCKEMSINLGISPTHCTIMIKRNIIKRGKFVGYIFSYV